MIRFEITPSSISPRMQEEAKAAFLEKVAPFVEELSMKNALVKINVSNTSNLLEDYSINFGHNVVVGDVIKRLSTYLESK